MIKLIASLFTLMYKYDVPSESANGGRGQKKGLENEGGDWRMSKYENIERPERAETMKPKKSSAPDAKICTRGRSKFFSSNAT